MMMIFGIGHCQQKISPLHFSPLHVKFSPQKLFLRMIKSTCQNNIFLSFFLQFKKLTKTVFVVNITLILTNIAL